MDLNIYSSAKIKYNIKMMRNLFVGFIIYIASVEASNILVVSNIPSVSHSMWNNKLVKLLADRGHKVIFLDVDVKKLEHENVTHYYMEGAYKYFQDFNAALESGVISLESVVEGFSTTGNINFITNPDVLSCRTLFSSPGYQKFHEDIKNYSVDLIIFDVGCEVFFALSPYLGNVPYIVASPYPEPFNLLQIGSGVFDNPAYVPTPFTLFQPEMNFKDKLLNIFYMIYYYYRVNVLLMPDQQALAEEVFGQVGSLHDLVSNIGLFLYTNHFMVFGAKPLPPSVIPIAGFHIESQKPLPKDIKKFVDDAKDGFIYFSMGSNIKSVVMSSHNIQMFLDVFASLPQRVVWKLEIDNKTNIPPNVYISKWLPQNDILGHPNIRAFISHGGFHGVQEALHHGVPLLGMPVLFDQVPMIENLEKKGIALHLRYNKLSKAYFKEKLDQILNDNSIRNNMKEMSRIFLDSPQTPRERALFWIEYALRNSNQMDFIRSQSTSMHWYQRTMLDIFLAVLILAVLFSIVLMKISRFIINLIFTRRNKIKMH